jgi:hypothetical protein
MELKCRDATIEDIARPTRVFRSTGEVRHKNVFVNPNRGLFLAWDYQESCGMINPMKRKEAGIMSLLTLANAGVGNEESGNS